MISNVDDLKTGLENLKPPIAAEIGAKVAELATAEAKGDEHAAEVARVHIQQARDNAANQVNDKVDRFCAHVRATMTVNPADITDDAKLFDMPVAASLSDVMQLVDRNRDNPTMMLLANRYAAKQGMKLPDGYTVEDPESVIAAAEKLRADALSWAASVTEATEADASTREAFGV